MLRTAGVISTLHAQLGVRRGVAQIASDSGFVHDLGEHFEVGESAR